MTTILVTGGLGFIGSHLINFMVSSDSSKELRIVNMDYKGYGSHINNIDSSTKTDTRYTFIEADINDVEKLSSISDIDIIINAAAETHVDRSIMDPSDFVHSNYNGTFALLEFSRKSDVTKYIQISTDEVYGEIKDQSRSFTELDNITPGNPYSSTKAAADLMVMAYFKTYGIRTLVTRCTNNFGPKQFPEKLIPRSIIRTLIDLPVLLYGDGMQIRDWLCVTDHVKAIDIVMRKGEAGQIYNISAANHMTNKDLVNRISSFLKEKTGKAASIKLTDDRPGHDYRYSLDSTKITNKLGWKPETDFQKALEQTVLWYVNNKDWWNDLIDPFVTGKHPWQSST
jgi:dTDP-glucose 4,6-dehydratase